VYFDSDSGAGLQVAERALKTLKEGGFLDEGDQVIMTQGDQMEVIGSTNTMRVLTVK
jgi:pyruvate kinase